MIVQRCWYTSTGCGCVVGDSSCQYLLTEEGLHCGEVFLTFLSITFTFRAVLHGLFLCCN